MQPNLRSSQFNEEAFPYFYVEFTSLFNYRHVSAVIDRWPYYAYPSYTGSSKWNTAEFQLSDEMYFSSHRAGAVVLVSIIPAAYHFYK